MGVKAYIRVSHITHMVDWLVGFCLLASSFFIVVAFLLFCFGVVVVLVSASFQDILFCFLCFGGVVVLVSAAFQDILFFFFVLVLLLF